jgi:hypothetical protein
MLPRSPGLIRGAGCPWLLERHHRREATGRRGDCRLVARPERRGGCRLRRRTDGGRRRSRPWQRGIGRAVRLARPGMGNGSWRPADEFDQPRWRASPHHPGHPEIGSEPYQAGADDEPDPHEPPPSPFLAGRGEVDVPGRRAGGFATPEHASIRIFAHVLKGGAAIEAGRWPARVESASSRW